MGPNGKQSPPLSALVDSGCDCSTFPKAWAALLGIDFQADCEAIEGHTASGTNNHQRRYQPGIHGLVHGHKVPLHAIFNPHIPIALVGRDDFFEFFKIEFDQRKKVFWLEPY